MKRSMIALLTGAALLLCGCSTTAGSESAAETLPPMTEPPEPVVVQYVTDLGTVDAAQVTRLRETVENRGYIWQTDSIAALAMNADAVIVNTPREDITPEILDTLGSYMDNGGHLFFLMPADESETRYKYWERFLEQYCITMDYDRLVETDKTRMQEDDPQFLRIDQIHAPSGMTILPATADTPLYMHDVRSFHFVVLNNYSNIQQDVMLKAASSAVGEPCGGVADDPVTYEDEALMTLVYSRDTSRRQSFVICAGAADFLLDANYDAPTSQSAQDYILAALDWAAHPTGF